MAKRLPGILEDAENDLPGVFRELLDRLRAHLNELDRQVQELEVLINAWHRRSEGSQKLAQIPGIGPLTASALAASIGDLESGTVVRARFAQFLELQDGRITAQRNYDCFYS